MRFEPELSEERNMNNLKIKYLVERDEGTYTCKSSEGEIHKVELKVQG